MIVDKGRFTQRIELFESQRNDVQSYFDKGIQELIERSEKGAKLLEKQQKCQIHTSLVSMILLG